MQADGFNADGTFISFVASQSDTISIVMRYSPDVNRDGINVMVDTERKMVQQIVKNYGWDKWVKIREDVKVL